MRGEPAVGALALLQVFRSREEIGQEVRLDHRFAIGRDEDCALRLKWDGVSKRHIFLEAFHLPGRRSGQAQGSVGWFLTGNGSNGTFVNSVKVQNGRLERLRDGDVIGLGKGASMAAGEKLAREDLQVYMFVFREPGSTRATPIPPPPAKGRARGKAPSGALAREPTAGGLNAGRGADAHVKCEGEVRHPCICPTFAPSSYRPSPADKKGPDVGLELDFVYGYASGGRLAENARCNIFYNVEGKITYPAGTMGVVYDLRSRTQHFFTEHDANISYMAMHPNKRFVATAGVASQRRKTDDGRPSVSIMVWDTTRSPPVRVCKPLARQHQYSIHAMAFSTSGRHLITMGGDSKYASRLVIYDWAKAGLGLPGEMAGKLELGILALRDGPCIIPAGGQLSLTLAVNPYVTDKRLTRDVLEARGSLYEERTSDGEVLWPRVEEGDAFHMVHCVDKATRMYNMAKIFDQPTRAARLMTGFTTPQKGLSAAWVSPTWFPAEGRPLLEVSAVGLQLGDIFFFQLVGSEITVTHKIEMAHKGEVLALVFAVKTAPGPGEAGEQYLLSGGRDGKLKGWDARLSWSEPVFELDLGLLAHDGTEHVVAVRAIDYDPLRRKVLVGTSLNCIYEVDLVRLQQGRLDDCCQELVSAHFGSVLSVAPVAKAPSRSQKQEQARAGLCDCGGEDFVTTATDGTIRFWSCSERRQTRVRVMGLEGRSVDLSPDASLLAVGHSHGQWSVWETRRLQCIYVNSHTNADIHRLKFSPDSTALAVVCDKGDIRLYDCTRYAVAAPRGQEEEFYGDGNIKGREKQLRKDRFNFMLAHKGNHDGSAPVAQVRVGSRLNPEQHARHLVRAAPTSGIADKVTAQSRAKHDAPVLPAFKMMACTARRHATTIANLDFSADGKWLRTSDGNGELLFWGLPSLHPETRAHLVRDTVCIACSACGAFWRRRHARSSSSSSACAWCRDSGGARSGGGMGCWRQPAGSGAW